MNTTQAIQNPWGVTVFGSAVLYVEPDVASLYFTVSRLEQHPKDGFAATREEDVNPDQLRGHEQNQSILRLQASKRLLMDAAIESIRYKNQVIVTWLIYKQWMFCHRHNELGKY